jgi:hypothetical protein
MAPRHQPRHGEAVGACARPSDTHDITATPAIIEKGSHGAGEVGIDWVSLLARNHQVAAEELRVLANVFQRHRCIQRAALGKANEGRHIQAQGIFRLGRECHLANDAG